ncbi:ATP-binding protein [Bernardetia sp. Wsw4-3y2]|uniref:ATP-binding protein n=1 Tax=Bernardetia sp. Wsw4-3y2 TaxID=3127471 RepID=UPI0030D38035
MKAQLFIEKLSQSNTNYLTPEQAISQANSLDLLSKDIYTDEKRFVYELLQNADDASSASGELDINIDFIDDYIIVSHKGEPFSEIDIESISSAGDGTKSEDNNKTGFKGIGFKSVFSHSNFVMIKSGEFCFKFDKQHWDNHWNKSWSVHSEWQEERKFKKKDTNLKMPWQIIPLWADLPKELQNLSIFQEYSVSTIIRYTNIELLKNALNDLFSQSQIALFLRSKKVMISINTDKKTILEKDIIGEVTTLKLNGKKLSDWLIKTEQFSIPKDVRVKINSDDKSPKKLKEAQKTEISFALQIENGTLKSIDKANRLIFTYLPTSINYDLPFLVNASFLTDAGREHLHQDTFWNQWLFEQIPIKFLSWVATLAHKNSKYKKQVLTILPHQLGSSLLEQSFNKGFSTALQSTAFIPNINGDLLKVKEAVLDKTDISECINPQTVVNYLNHRKNTSFSISSFVPYLEPISVLSKLGVEMFSIDDLTDFFNSSIFKEEHKVSENFKLISFLYEKVQNSHGTDRDNIWNKTLEQTNFIFDEKEELRKPVHIYFPAVEFSSEFSADMSIIHESVVSQINADANIKKWIEQLGVKEPSDLSFIENTIIAQDDFVTEKNSLKVVKYIFNAHKKGLLKQWHYDKLQSLKLLTKKKTLIPASSAYLSDFYDPELKLENDYQHDFYVSEDYFEGRDLKSEWKTFFIKIKVNEDISIVNLKSNKEDLVHVHQFAINYFYDYENPKGYPNWRFYEYKLTKITFIELTQNYTFAAIFWKKVFSKYSPNQINIQARGFWGFEGSSGARTGNALPSYSEWFIEDYNCIPTNQKTCLRASKVYSNSIPNISILAGKYLPVFTSEVTVPSDWQQYLKIKDKLELDDYLQILSKIWKDTKADKAENQDRIKLIYDTLASMSLHSDDQEEIKEWSKSNKILARDGNFYPPHELQLVSIKGFKSDKLVYPQTEDTKTIDFLSLLGVKIIDKVIPIISNSKVELTDLKKKLQHISPLITLVSVVKSKNRKEWKSEYEAITQKLSTIRFFETTAISLSYGDEGDIQKRSSWAEGDIFYYVGRWSSSRVLDSLVELLVTFLGIRYTERILMVLLIESFNEGLEYLKEQGFDTSLIPDEILNPSTPEFENLPTRSTSKISEEDLKKKGELEVFKKLKEIYSEKYNQSVLEETKEGFKVGADVEVIWRNINEDTTFNHDFKVMESNKNTFIRSKTTNNSKTNQNISLHGNELDLMEKANTFLIARVYEVSSEKPSIEFMRLQEYAISERN